MSRTYSYGFDISDLDLGSPVTKNQIKQIEKLVQKKDFDAATLDVEENIITFAYWDEYETLVTFLKKLVIIKQDIYAHLTVEDREDEEYWMIEIMGTSLEECHGTVFWGNSEDKLRIRKVLEAHLEAEEEHMTTIVEQLTTALKGEYDHLEDDEEPTDEELEEIEDVQEKE